MYATAYRTPLGFSSVGFLAGFSGKRVRIGDPIFGWQVVDAEDCFCVIFTESGYVLPDVQPVLSKNMVSDWLMPEEERERLSEHGRLAANRPGTVTPIFLQPELGGEEFPSGYPLAWQRIRRWREHIAPDWRSLALSAIFARSSIQRPIEECERLYRQFGPTLRDALLRDERPSRSEMRRWRGIRGTRAERGKRAAGLDDLRSYIEILEWAPWAARQIASTEDTSRLVRDAIALRWLPWGLGVAKLSFTMMLAGRDAACIDTRMLNYFLGAYEPGAEEFEPSKFDDGDIMEAIAGMMEERFTVKRMAAELGISEPEVKRYQQILRGPRLQFLSAVSRRSTRKGFVVDGEQRNGVTDNAMRIYAGVEDRLSTTPYFDPDWPQPYAKAQWLLWETLGRTAGTASHSALWHVIDPLIEQVTEGELEPIPEHMQMNAEDYE